MMKQWLLRICICAALPVFFLTGCGKSSDTLATKNTLVVGMDLSYPPFETIDAQGKPIGVSVEIARALGKYLGKKIAIENIPFSGLIPSLKTGKIDLVISSMTATPERRNSIIFSNPYATTGLAVLVKKDSPINSATDMDLPGKTIVVRQGTTGQVYAMQSIAQAKVVSLDKESSAVLEVVQGKADGFIYDQMSVWKNSQQNPETTKAILQPFQKEKWAIGMRKGDTELCALVNNFLAQFKKEGGFNALGDKYLKEQKEAFKAQGIPFVF